MDFEIKEAKFDIDTAWKKKLNAEGLSEEAGAEMMAEAMRTHNNVVHQITIVLRVVKG